MSLALMDCTNESETIIGVYTKSHPYLLNINSINQIKDHFDNLQVEKKATYKREWQPHSTFNTQALLEHWSTMIV